MGATRQSVGGNQTIRPCLTISDKEKTRKGLDGGEVKSGSEAVEISQVWYGRVDSSD